MTKSRRTLGLCLALAALASPSFSQDLGGLYSEGVDLLSRGRKTEALAKFQAILAADPTNEAAYELWKEADHQVFLDLIVEGGEYQLVAERLLARAKLGRSEHRNDAGAVRALVSEMLGESDALVRRRTVTQLSSEHGPYAAPALVPYLGNEGDGDRRVLAMATLIELGGDVVWPLIAALGSDHAYQRRNVAICLGRIGDPRAAGALEAIAALDGDSAVVKAAKSAAAACGSTGNGLSLLLADGHNYYGRNASHIRPFDDQNVTWSWDGALTSSDIAVSLFNDQMALSAFYRALDLDAANGDAQAGIARACGSIVAKAGRSDDLADAGVGAQLTLSAAGVGAIDMALLWAVKSDDASAGAALCQTLGGMASAPTSALMAAVASGDPTLRGEGALALASIATRSGTAAGGATVAALGDAAGREVLRVAAVIDGDAERAGKALAGLASSGVIVDHRGSGIEGIVLVRRMPVVDLVLVGDRVNGLTTDQVLADIANNVPNAPVFLLSGDEDFADAYSDRVAGVISDSSDLSGLEETLNADFEGARARADDLGRRAAMALGALALAGHTDCSATADALASTLAHRSEAVTAPAMAALAQCGSWDHIHALFSVLGDSDRSDNERSNAAMAMGPILARSGAAEGVAGPLAAIAANGDESTQVRMAAAQALGMAQTGAAGRTQALGALRGSGSQ
ncbi:MAG: hypothetical protein CMJ86_02025 [Planctomycetes bacterium]|nr:hypothetical protein [Planctomycetota bacterium]